MLGEEIRSERAGNADVDANAGHEDAVGNAEANAVAAASAEAADAGPSGSNSGGTASNDDASSDEEGLQTRPRQSGGHESLQVTTSESQTREFPAAIESEPCEHLTYEQVLKRIRRVKEGPRKGWGSVHDVLRLVTGCSSQDVSKIP